MCFFLRISLCRTQMQRRAMCGSIEVTVWRTPPEHFDIFSTGHRLKFKWILVILTTTQRQNHLFWHKIKWPLLNDHKRTDALRLFQEPSHPEIISMDHTKFGFQGLQSYGVPSLTAEKSFSSKQKSYRGKDRGKTQRSPEKRGKGCKNVMPDVLKDELFS